MPEVSQQTKQQPGQYPAGGEEIWEQFLFKFFGDEGTGDPGAEQIQGEQTQYLMDQLGQFVDAKTNALDTYQNQMDNIQPTQVSFGGEPVTTIYPRRPQEMAGSLFKAATSTADDIFSGSTSITPQQGQLEHMNLLNQLANNLQTWRYGTPTQTTEAEKDQGTVGEVADWVNVATKGFDLLGGITSGDNFISDLFDW